MGRWAKKWEEKRKGDSQYFVTFCDSLEVEVDARPSKKIGGICSDLSDMLEFSLWQDLGLRAKGRNTHWFSLSLAKTLGLWPGAGTLIGFSSLIGKTLGLWPGAGTLIGFLSHWQRPRAYGLGQVFSLVSSPGPLVGRQISPFLTGHMRLLGSPLFSSLGQTSLGIAPNIQNDSTRNAWVIYMAGCDGTPG